MVQNYNLILVVGLVAEYWGVAVSPARKHMISAKVGSDGNIDFVDVERANFVRNEGRRQPDLTTQLEPAVLTSKTKHGPEATGKRAREVIPTRNHMISAKVGADGDIKVSDVEQPSVVRNEGLHQPDSPTDLELATAGSKSTHKPEALEEKTREADVLDEYEDTQIWHVHARGDQAIIAVPPKIARDQNTSYNNSMRVITHMTVAVSCNRSARRIRPESQEDLPNPASLAQQQHKLTMMMLAYCKNGVRLLVRSIRKNRGSKSDLLGLALLVVLGIIVTYLSLAQRRTEDEAVVREIGFLRNATTQALKFKDNGDWFGALSKFIKLRADKFNANHPLYGTLSTHFGKKDVQSQIHHLFSQLSGDTELITSESVQLMCSGFSSVAKNVTSDRAPFPHKPQTLEEYQWFVECIDRPLSSPEFTSIFVLWVAYYCQLRRIIRRGNGTVQADRGEAVDQVEFQYSVEFGGKVAYREGFTLSSFDRVGVFVFANKEVEEHRLSCDSLASLESLASVDR